MEFIASLSESRSISRQPLSEQVYEVLRGSILYGKIPVETKLNEVDVAKQLNVSATPVREAFRRLAVENLVTIEPWKGVVVKGYSVKEIIEVYQCRESLEGMAARLAARQMGTEAVEELERTLLQAAKIVSPDEVVTSNRALHQLILKGSGNRKLASLLQVFQELIWRDMKITAEDASRRQAVCEEHARVVQAIRARDQEEAEYAMREHIRKGFAFRYEQRTF